MNNKLSESSLVELSLKEYKVLSESLSAIHNFNSKYTYYSESAKASEFKKLIAEQANQLSSYSEYSRNNSLFLSKFFSVEREPKQYAFVGEQAFKDPMFLAHLLDRKVNVDLFLMFDQSMLDEHYEKEIWNHFDKKKYPILKYCVNEHYLKNKDENTIHNTLIDLVFKNYENLDFIPEKYLKDDKFFEKIIYKNYRAQQYSSNNYNSYNRNEPYPTNILEQRSSHWWNNNPELFRYCLNNFSFNDTPKFKNVKSNPLYRFMIMQKFPKSFRKKEDHSEDSILRILASQHYIDFYSALNGPLNLDKFMSSEIIDIFKKDLPFISFHNKHSVYVKDWNSYTQHSPRKDDEKFYASETFITLTQQILSSLTEKQYNEFSLFKPVSTGNPLLVLNLAKENKPQDFMLSDCIIALHQNVLLNDNDQLYYKTIETLFKNHFKYTIETLGFQLDKKNVNLYDINSIKTKIYPLIEEHYLNYIVPPKEELIKRTVLKF